MTSLLNIAGNIPVSAAAVGGQSLRFEDGDSAYLSFTPASAGNRKTWTWSGWVKRGNIDTASTLFSTGSGTAGTNTNNAFLQFTSTNRLRFLERLGGSNVDDLNTTVLFRDASAWYHVVLVRDSTEATASDRIKLFVNGIQITAFHSSNYPALNADGQINNTNAHAIGERETWNSEYLDGYLANVAFIDGTALDPTSFGEYDDTLWKPKSDTDIQSLTFGTNGFYLPFKQTTEAEGFSTVTWTGNGGTQSIEGVGFEPDFVWIKGRNNTGAPVLQDSVRGSNGSKYRYLVSSNTAAEAVQTDNDGIDSLDSNGFTVGYGNSNAWNQSGSNYVAWCWDAGTGSAVSNTDGTITSSVKANTAKGFSITSFVGNATAGATVGHGLTSTPEMIISKNRDDANNWLVYHKDLDASNPEQKRIFLNLTSAVSDSDTPWNDTAPTSSLLTLGTSGYTNGSSDDMIMYCFHSVSGYSSIGTYSGTGAAGNAVTGLGFKPTWLMIKRTDVASDWIIWDATRDVDGKIDGFLYANLSVAEAFGSNVCTFDSDGFTLNDGTANRNASGGTYIYMAFADTRDATFFGDTSGNSNNWTPNALNNTDVVPDSPVTGGNFATFNPTIPTPAGTFSEGNLKFTGGTAWGGSKSSIGVPSSGKWYAEARVMTTSSNTYQFSFGIKPYTTLSGYTLTKDYAWFFNNGFFILTNGAFSTNGGFTTPAGTIVQIAIDADNGKVWLGYNNSWYDTYNTTNGNPSAGTNETFSGLDFEADDFAIKTDCVYNACFANFGADSSFSGNETPQGNTDDNGVGDFYYAPPSGFLCLKTSSLPTPTITAPDEYFNTVLWTGDGSAQSITGVGFQPDLIWTKSRSNAYSNLLYDSVRGATNGSTDTALFSNTADAENTYGILYHNLASFDSDGFTTGLSTSTDVFNGSGVTQASWNWLAGGTAVSNTDGSITSTVSANTDAGFSIVNYIGDGGAGETSVGHGLSQTPELIIYKNRDTTGSWPVTYTVVDGSNDFMYLNSTVAAGNATQTLPTSSVFYIQSSAVQRNSGQNYIQYCFHSVEGYSKIGSYTGNGSSDGTFVHCGFRPAWVMVKRTDNVGNWWIHDAKRNTYNVVDNYLFADSSNAEASYDNLDILSNGFKLRLATYQPNTSGGSFIFMAFAEAPFSKSNAR